MIPVRHAISVAAAGAKVAGDSGIECAITNTGVYTVTTTTPMPVSTFGAAIITRRGGALRWVASVEHTGERVKRIVLRDLSGGVLASAFDVLLLGTGRGNAELSQVARGSVVGSSGALYAGDAAAFTPARTGAGVYTLTLTTALPAASCPSIQVTRRGTELRYYAAVEHTSDDVKTVRILDSAGQPLDSDFDFSIWRVV